MGRLGLSTHLAAFQDEELDGPATRDGSAAGSGGWPASASIDALARSALAPDDARHALGLVAAVAVDMEAAGLSNDARRLDAPRALVGAASSLLATLPSDATVANVTDEGVVGVADDVAAALMKDQVPGQAADAGALHAPVLSALNATHPPVCAKPKGGKVDPYVAPRHGKRRILGGRGVEEPEGGADGARLVEDSAASLLVRWQSTSRTGR